ncbi:MAG: TetR/AcrR family transcriptional regulator [Parvularculaceae bacterium]|nr:TetR/AcrR family transcriptional regulator [Parvularculaceae bacterium]
MADRFEQRERVTELLVDHVLATGLAETSVRQLAKAAGISDRMLIYYFESKNNAMTRVLLAGADRLKAVLEQSVPEGTKLAPPMMFMGIATALRQPELQPYMSLWIDIVAAAQRHPEPYAPIASAIGTLFLDWLEDRMMPVEGLSHRTACGAVLGMVDGLALMEACLPESETVGIDAAMMAWLPPSKTS